MSSNNYNLPPGWSWVKLGDIVKFIRGVSFPKDAKCNSYEEGKVCCLRTANVQKEVDWDDLWFIDEKIVKRDEQYLRIGDILISSANSLELLGKVSFVRSIPYKSTLGTFIVNIRVQENQINKFIFYYLTTRKFIDEVQKNASTTTNISNISVGKLENIKIRIAPLPIQQKIVDKIEELFSELDNGIENLRKAKEQIKTYKQSVLAYAFSGKLTEDVKGETENGKFPKGWKWVNLGEVIKSLQYGTSEKATGSEKGIPVLRMGNIQDGAIVFSNLKYFPNEYSEIDKYLLENDDILFNRTNSAELVGKSAIYRKDYPKSIFASYLIRIKINKEIYSATLLNYYINSSYGKDYIKSVVSQNVGQANVNGTKLKNMPVLLIPFCEQLAMVSEIERRFSAADKLEQTIDESLAKAEQLKQSILKQAFGGRLLS